MVNGMRRSVVWALSIGLLGSVGCMGEDDPDGADPSMQAPNEDEIGDSELAAEITRRKLAAVPEAATSPRFASCGRNGPTNLTERVSDASSPDAARQRSGSSTGCPTDGVLQPTDDAIYYCWTNGNDGFSWTYLRSVRTGQDGWTRDDLLKFGGALDARWCGF